MVGQGGRKPMDLLAEPERAQLLRGFHRRRLSRGELLSQPGAERDSVFILEKGRIRVFLALEDKEHTLTFLEPGDLYSTHSDTYVQAVSDSELLSVPTRQMLSRLSEVPAAAPVIVSVLGQALGHAMRLIEDLALRDVEGRLARFLQGMQERRGEPTAAGIRLHLDLTTEDIARLLGTTRQTVSSLLNRFVREGVLSRIAGGGFLILDVDQLRARSQRSRMSAG